jgi:hypothetical protein
MQPAAEMRGVQCMLLAVSAFSLGTLPDRGVLAGATVIVLCGLCLLRRERVHVEAEHA